MVSYRGSNVRERGDGRRVSHDDIPSRIATRHSRRPSRGWTPSVASCQHRYRKRKVRPFFGAARTGASSLSSLTDGAVVVAVTTVAQMQRHHVSGRAPAKKRKSLGHALLLSSN